jgi:hypothetical protein
VQLGRPGRKDRQEFKDPLASRVHRDRRVSLAQLVRRVHLVRLGLQVLKDQLVNKDYRAPRELQERPVQLVHPVQLVPQVLKVLKVLQVLQVLQDPKVRLANKEFRDHLV